MNVDLRTREGRAKLRRELAQSATLGMVHSWAYETLPAALDVLDAADDADASTDSSLPEDDDIDAAFPTRSGRHDLYAEAMRLVGARRSKAGLVALVNWLLTRCAAAKKDADGER